MKKIIVCCGAGCATSSMLEEEMKELCEKNGIQAKITKCLVGQVKDLVRMDDYDLVVPSGKYSLDTNGAPLVSGMAFITGIGKDKTIAKILEILNA